MKRTLLGALAGGLAAFLWTELVAFGSRYLWVRRLLEHGHDFTRRQALGLAWREHQHRWLFVAAAAALAAVLLALAGCSSAAPPGLVEWEGVVIDRHAPNPANGNLWYVVIATQGQGQGRIITGTVSPKTWTCLSPGTRVTFRARRTFTGALVDAMILCGGIKERLPGSSSTREG